MVASVRQGFMTTSGATLYGGRPELLAGTGVTINDVTDYTMYQRVGTSKTVSLGGTCTGSPSRLEWRLVDWTTGIARTSWATLINNPPATWSASVDYPQGGWDKVEVRDAVNTALTHSTINRMGVGIKIGMIGQSNMANRPTTAQYQPLGDRRVIEMPSSGVPGRVGNINDAQAANLESNQPGYSTPSVLIVARRGDGYTLFGNLVAQGLNIPVMLIEVGASGSAIASWMSGQSNWIAFTTRIALAGGDFESALWHQGETDANTMSTATMKLRLADLHGQLKTLSGRTDANFHFGIIGLGIGSFSGSSEGEFGNMRAAHAQYAAENSGAYFSTSAHDTYTSDGVHLQGLSFNKIGRRDAKSLLARLGVGVSGAGPKIASAARSGTVVTLTITHAGGTALLDGDGGAGTALTGFQFFDAGAAGAEIATTASSISGNTIILTLASAPVGALTMSYAMANNPHSANATTAPTLASIVYDNTTYHNSSIGCPLQPCAAITVTN